MTHINMLTRSATMRTYIFGRPVTALFRAAFLIAAADVLALLQQLVAWTCYAHLS